MYNLKDKIYSWVRQENYTAFGDTYKFFGPNIQRYCSYVHFLQPYNKWAQEHWDKKRSESEADIIVSLLHSAYEAGRESMRQEIWIIISFSVLIFLISTKELLLVILNPEFETASYLSKRFIGR